MTKLADLGLDETPHFRDRSFGMLIGDINILMDKLYSRERRRLDENILSRSQAYLITVLLEEDGLSQKQIADRMSVEKSALGSMLDRLEGAGWVRRLKDQKDKRLNRVYLTDMVYNQASGMKRISDFSNTTALAGLDDDSMQNLLTLLCNARAQLQKALDNEQDPAAAAAALGSTDTCEAT